MTRRTSRQARWASAFAVALPLVAAACAGAVRLGGGGNALGGRWSGHWMRGLDSLPVTMELRADSSGALSGTFSSDRLRVAGIPFSSIERQGCCAATITLRGDATTSVFEVTAAGGRLTGTFTEAGRTGTVAFARDAAAPLAATAAPAAGGAGAGAFHEVPVEFSNGAVNLAGTLFVPAAAGRHPAVAMVHGSGPEGRAANRYLAIELARNGVAALTYDKRGVGASSGDWRTAAFEELAGDAVRGIGMLGQRADIDPARIGAYGHSQGATMLPMVAERNAAIAFLVAGAPAGVPLDSLERFSLRNAMGVRSLPAAEAALAESYASAVVATAYRGAPRARLDSLARTVAGRPWYFAPPAPDDGYWKLSARIANYAADAHWKAVNSAVMLVFGANDERVPVEPSRDAIVAALDRAAPRLITTCTYPDADHSLRVRTPGDEWPRSAPGYVDDVVRWIRVAVRLDAAPPRLSGACR